MLAVVSVAFPIILTAAAQMVQEVLLGVQQSVKLILHVHRHVGDNWKFYPALMMVTVTV